MIRTFAYAALILVADTAAFATDKPSLNKKQQEIVDRITPDYVAQRITIKDDDLETTVAISSEPVFVEKKRIAKNCLE